MRTCETFSRIKAGYEQDITFLRNHSQLHNGTPAAKRSARNAGDVKRRMAQALVRHHERCPFCT